MKIELKVLADPAAADSGATGAWRVRIATSEDIVEARQEGKRLGATLRFSATELTMIASAISEIARNIVEHARDGEIRLSIVSERGRRGLQVEAEDRGPGIPDIARAMQVGYSSGNGLGLGLPGARQLMDEFAIESAPGAGTRIKMKKWESGRSGGDRA